MDYLTHIGVLFVMYAILGLSLNLIVGYTGLFAVTHAIFYGIGAYSTAILLTQFGANFFVSTICGIFAALIISLPIGIILSWFEDDYYAIVSIGFSVIVFLVFMNWEQMTRGPLGVPGIARPSIFGFDFLSNLHFFIMSLFFLLIVYIVCKFIVKSSFGRVLKAIRENEKAIQVYGYNTGRYKLAIFVAGAVMASIAGSLYATYLTFIHPSVFSLNESIFILAIVFLGGVASLRGSLLGALFLILLPEALRFLGLPTVIAAQARQFIYGVTLIILMIFRPQGLVGEYKL